MLQRGRRLEPEALKSGHARGPTPLGASPSFSYEGGGVKPLTRLAPQHPAPNAAPEGHQFSGTIFIAKNAPFPTEFGLLDAFFGCPMGGPKNDPGEHHRLSFFNFGQIRVADVFWVALATERTPTRARIMSISGLGFGFRMRLRAWKTQKSL